MNDQPAGKEATAVPADTRSSTVPPGISVPTSGQDLPGPALWISNVSTPRCKFAHKSSVQGTDTYAVHTHPFYEIVYVLSGDVEFMVGDHPFPVGEHTLVAFPPELRHGALIRPDRPYERYTLHFDASCLSMERRMLLQEVFPSLPPASDPGAEAGCVWRSMRSSGVLQCLEAMETLNRVSGETAAMLLPIHVEALLATLYAVQQVRGTAVRHEAHPTTTQQDLVLWVEQHYTDNITLESLSERFFLSRGYINTLFRQATGSTVKAYVLKRRMNYVQMLLSAGLPAAISVPSAIPPPLPSRLPTAMICWRKPSPPAGIPPFFHRMRSSIPRTVWSWRIPACATPFSFPPGRTRIHIMKPFHLKRRKTHGNRRAVFHPQRALQNPG